MVMPLRYDYVREFGSPGTIYGEMGAKQFEATSRRGQHQKAEDAAESYVEILPYTPPCTHELQVYPEELFEYTQMSFYENVGDRKK